jgi:uncharacterized protein (TIGR03545 family)
MRWKGLIVFIAVVVVIVVAWVFLADGMLRRTIEIVGTRAVGAQVDLARADLTLFPAGLSLEGLAVTDPDAPTQNAVEIAAMKMDLEAGYLIRRKVVINDLIVEGLRFNTARRHPGEVLKSAEKKKSGSKKEVNPDAGPEKTMEKLCGEFSLPSLSQPDVNAILSKESLKSVALAADLETKLNAARSSWEKELKQLPSEKTLRGYQKKIEKLTKGGGSLGALLGAVGDAQKLQEDIEKDLKRLKRARKTLTRDYKTYKKQVDNLAKAPAKDINRLMKKYSLSPAGLANLSQMIFGDQLCGWVKTAANWYRKLEPYLARAPKQKEGPSEAQQPLRGKGRNIRFAETPPMPDFLIRHLKLNAALDIGNLTGRVENITPDQHILGRPMTFAILGREMQRIKALDLDGALDHVRPGDPENKARMTVKGLTFQDLALVQDPSFPLTLKRAVSNLNLRLNTAGDSIDGVLKVNFRAARFITDSGDAPGDIAGALGSALGGIRRFSLSADIAGTLSDYTVDVSSDLDKVLESAISNLVKAEAAKLKSALKKQISAQLKGPLAQSRAGLADLGGINTDLAKRLDFGDDLLKNFDLSL